MQIHIYQIALCVYVQCVCVLYMCSKRIRENSYRKTLLKVKMEERRERKGGVKVRGKDGMITHIHVYIYTYTHIY